MTTTDLLRDTRPPRPTLPTPTRERWQPLRLGLVELFHYDSEEFWFRDGHLLLRGNNGTGKSKVLSLVLPFLFDASLRPSRIEPDGDGGKRMAWNLLMNRYPRRIGYTWIEFGRRAADGSLHYLTLGAGLSAVSTRAQVDSWFFVLDGSAAQAGLEAQAPARLGEALWLMNDQGVVLTRERLREALQGRGQVFEHAGAYRRAVDERLFEIGPRRYDALMDTLIQLRQPQLSKKPDEAGLSHALTESLPPLPKELLGDVAEALAQLEEDRRQLEDVQALAKAVTRFDERYRVYAGMLSRRQAGELRQAQTGFDNASQERHLAQAGLEAAEIAETAAIAESDAREHALAALRSRYETLQSDPTLQDARELERAAKEAERRAQAVQIAAAAAQRAREVQARDDASLRQCQTRAAQAEHTLQTARQACLLAAEDAGLAQRLADHPLLTWPPAEIQALEGPRLEQAPAALRQALSDRREDLTALRRRHTALQQASQALAQARERQREHLAEHDQALARRAHADAAAEQAGQTLLDDWARHVAGLGPLRFEAEGPLQALADWVLRPEGEAPTRHALHKAWQASSLQQAREQAALAQQQQDLEGQHGALEAERRQLVAGQDAPPPVPAARAADSRAGRAGAPFWQLVDFQPHASDAERAGLEAGLQGSGLLDAWVTPDGRLLLETSDRDGGAGTAPWLDQQWARRLPVAGPSLADWLCADPGADTGIAAVQIQRLLASVASSPTTVDKGPAGELLLPMSASEDAAEAWLGTDGRYRLGSLAGAWAKPQAAFIGHAARARARAARLAAIEQAQSALGAALTVNAQDQARWQALRVRADQEWQQAPDDLALRQAILLAAAAGRDGQATQERLARAEHRCREAERAWQGAHQSLQQDAADLRMPAAAEALPVIEAALQSFQDAQHQIVSAARDWHRIGPELREQSMRAVEAQAESRARDEDLAGQRLEAQEARARYEVLREAVGAQVKALQRQLDEARQARDAGERQWRTAQEARRVAGESRAAAAAHTEAAEARLQGRSEVRALAVTRLERFAQTSLLSAALPDLALPDLPGAWTIDPALTLARRIEQALAQVPEDDASWARVKNQITVDLQELQRALGALGHQAPAEASDWGFVVHILYHNQPERPDQLAARLADDIAQRIELLSAHERTVLENHLQAEIAAEVQRLLRAAEQQVQAINRELHKRPTSTGVRYRLQWQPLTEDEGAPIGLEAARQRLLHTSTDLWSAEDRRVVGAMLQQRIDAERERADAVGLDAGSLGSDAGGGLIDQLARALDYRRWHRFRVERLQDGQWRKLSGPASSGERALGLTVPLFAAIASFYSQGCHPYAPRLMLLDEAFAGIDDAARAHCMGLIREFDLDFVITSEREWACYAELPGVSICQLQRREGIEAVFVSRWSWDGRAKRRDEDPDRRFPTALVGG